MPALLRKKRLSLRAQRSNPDRTGLLRCARNDSFFFAMTVVFFFITPVCANQTAAKLKFYQFYNLTSSTFLYKTGDSKECQKLNIISSKKKTEATIFFEEDKNINCTFRTIENSMCEMTIYFSPKSLLKLSASESCKRFDFQPYGKTQNIEEVKIKRIA